MQTNGFGSSSYDDKAWAALSATTGPRFRVSDAAAWAPTVVTTADRTVRITPVGFGIACGVRAGFAPGEAAPTVQCAANTSAVTRVDLIVARYNWTAKTVTFVALQGGAGPVGVNTTTTIDNAKINRIPGVQYDAVIGAIRVRSNVGAMAATDLADMRVWGAIHLELASTSYTQQIDLPAGTEVFVSGLRYVLNAAANLTATGPMMITNMAARPTRNRVPGMQVRPSDRPSVVYVWDTFYWIQEGLSPGGLDPGFPAGCYVTRQEGSSVLTTGNSVGGFNIPLPFPFNTNPLMVSMNAGDSASELTFVRPIGVNHTPGTIHGQCFTPNGAMRENQLVRVNWVAIGFNT